MRHIFWAHVADYILSMRLPTRPAEDCFVAWNYERNLDKQAWTQNQDEVLGSHCHRFSFGSGRRLSYAAVFVPRARCAGRRLGMASSATNRRARRRSDGRTDKKRERRGKLWAVFRYGKKVWAVDVQTYTPTNINSLLASTQHAAIYNASFSCPPAILTLAGEGRENWRARKCFWIIAWLVGNRRQKGKGD